MILILTFLYRRHSPNHRSPSPTRRQRFDSNGYHETVGFSDTVSNVVEIQRHTHGPHSQYNHRHKIRGKITVIIWIFCYFFKVYLLIILANGTRDDSTSVVIFRDTKINI